MIIGVAQDLDQSEYQWDGKQQKISKNKLGQIIGEEKHTLSLEEMRPHEYGASVYGNFRNTSGTADRNMWQGEKAGATSQSGGGKAHNNMQPSLVINFVIKAR